MGWFSPVKGSMYSLSQVDKTLPVDSGVEDLERGNIVTLDKNAKGQAVWKLAGANAKTFYAALAGTTDPTSGFAGTAFDPAGGVPAITAIDLAMDGEYETDVYDPKATLEVGDALTVKDGVLTKAADGDKTVAILTQAPAARWINNAVALPKGGKDPRLAIRTGARSTVIRFKTAL